MRRKRGDEYNAAAATQDRKQLLHKEERRADIDREEMVEILHRQTSCTAETVHR
jgi:hypothetical protein